MKPRSTPSEKPARVSWPVEPISVRIPSAVKMTGLSRSTIYNLIKAGEIEIIKIGAITLIPLDSLRRFVDSRRSGP